MSGIERGKWQSKTEFVLSILGFSVGMGAIWRFPYLCYKSGGGAFLVPYLIMLCFCGIPLFFLETTLGQFSSLASTSVFEKLAPGLKGCAYAALVLNAICTMEYNMLISYPCLFLIDSFKKTLPWKTCGNWWNTDACIELDSGGMSGNQSRLFKTSADEYFHIKILNISDGPGEFGSLVPGLVIANFVCWTLTYLCIMKGIKSVGKVVYVTAVFPYIILLILFIRGVTLPGAWEGIKVYIMPEWKELYNLQVWANAATQMYFSLGPAWGGIVNMASYNDFRNKAQMDAIILPLVITGTSVFAGFVVFAILGYLSHQTGIPVREVASGGPSLAFVTYPEALGLLPFPQFFSVCFFLMLWFLAVDSCFVQIETCISSVTDQYPKLRSKQPIITICTCIFLAFGTLIFAFQNGMYTIQLFDYFAYSLTLVFICLMEVFMVFYCYGTKNFVRDISFMLEKGTINSFWTISWRYLAPGISIFIFVTIIAFSSEVTYNGVRYPEWAYAFGWCICLASLLFIPGYFLYRFSRVKGTPYERLQYCLSERNWAPADELDRERWQLVKIQGNSILKL